jgi:hypothetical protein
MRAGSCAVARNSEPAAGVTTPVVRITALTLPRRAGSAATGTATSISSFRTSATGRSRPHAALSEPIKTRTTRRQGIGLTP